jgi:hypothetical protein
MLTISQTNPSGRMRFTLEVSGTRSTLTCASRRLPRSHRNHRAALPLPRENAGEGKIEKRENKPIVGTGYWQRCYLNEAK